MSDLITQRGQAGIESTRGTEVNATRIIYPVITRTFEKPIREFQDTSGTYEARRRFAQGRERVGFSITDLATFEDLAWWNQLGIKGGVTGGAGDSGSPEMFLYTFTPSLATDDLKSVTLETGDALSSSLQYTSTQAMINSWTIRIDPDNEGGWLYDAELLARNYSQTAHTGSLTDRTTEVIKAPTTKLYIDDATIGSTQVTGKFISASITGNNNIHFKAFAEDEANFAANKIGRGARTFDAQIVLEFDSEAEFAKMRAGTQRFVRIETLGSVIHDAVTKKAQINMNGYWSTIGWGDREGNIIATFGLMCFYNATSGYALQMVIQNALETLP